MNAQIDNYLYEDDYIERKSNITFDYIDDKYEKKRDNTPKKTKLKLKNVKFEKVKLKNVINKDFYEKIDIQYFIKLLQNEKNEIMKLFYLNQTKILNSSKNPNIFNCNNLYDKMKEERIISKLSIKHFNKSIKLITNFIDQLLLNLENKYLIPYNIKVICKFINILIPKKFKNISRMKCDVLICRFLFDKLIFPVFENPDINSPSGKIIISLNTRIILYDIQLVLTKIIRGELFNSDEYGFFAVLNSYIIKTYKKIHNIIENIINSHVQIPKKLLKLSEQFYKTKDFSLKNAREKSDINYNYFEEKQNDFMQHKSICFNFSQFTLIYNFAYNKKDILIKKDKQFENLLEKITKNLGKMPMKFEDYYVIIDEEYNAEIKQLLSLKEKKMQLCKPKNKGDTLFKLKYCITYLFSNLSLLYKKNLINEDHDTNQTFDLINTYLKIHDNKIKNNIHPLYWYSLFIINNLKKIETIFTANDYQLLYDEIEYDILNLLEKYKKLNEFLTVDMTTKFNLIQKKIGHYAKELEKVKETELKIKIFLFIELNKINICIIKGSNYNKYKKILIQNEKPINEKLLILGKAKDCPILKIRAFNKTHQKNHHLSTTKEFASRFSNFHKLISDEIINSSLGITTNVSKKTIDPPEEKLKDFYFSNYIFTESPQEILDKYMNYINEEVENNPLFKIETKKIVIINDEENDNIKENIKNDKEEVKRTIKDVIKNFILKYLCIKIPDTSSLILNKSFYLKCHSIIDLIKPSNLKIPNELINENYINIVKKYFEKIDELKTPMQIDENIGIAVQFINCLFKFLLNVKYLEADSLNPLIYYLLFSSEPKRIIFNINFCKFFLKTDEMKGNTGMNIIQIESAINFIKKLEANFIGITQEEFNKYSENIKYT